MRFEDAYEGWTEKRLTQIDAARLLGICPLGRLGDHRNRRQGWNVKHYTAWYKREGGSGSTTWVKNTHQQAGVVNKAPKHGVHRKRGVNEPPGPA